ncbi:MAG: gluconokinase [Pyrinomonadaceae bacterium]
MSTVLDEVVLEDRPGVDVSVLAASLHAERDEPIVLSIDIGSSGMRAALFDSRGNEIAGSQVSLAHDSFDLLAGADIDADVLVEGVMRVIDVAVARAENFVSQINYVATSCFWHSLLGVDAEGWAVTPLFGWAETRAAAAVEQLRAQFHEAETHARTGARFHPSYWPAKLLWLQNEVPATFRPNTHWLSFPDYLFLKLFGQEDTSVSMASATGLFNQRTLDWDDELCDGLNISPSQLPEIAQPGQTFQLSFVNHLSRWPLLESAAWFPAIGDGAANNVGAGCVGLDRVALMIGTSGAMRVLLTGTSPSQMPSELFCYRADRDRIVIGGALSDGGGLVRWMKDSFGLNLESDDLESELDAMEPDAHGLTILPFWAGERATGWSLSAKGAIVGLTARTTPIEILRATMEAISYRFALLSRALDKVTPDATLVATGNALTSSATWLQMIADVVGREIEISEVNEASMRGAALLALEAAGKIDPIETIESFRGKIIKPDMARHEIFARAIERQQKLYEKMI